jgi:protein-L-isoaspartate O-methyltransferase
MVVSGVHRAGMKPNGIMVIPVGPPGAQHALKVTKQQTADTFLRPFCHRKSDIRA